MPMTTAATTAAMIATSVVIKGASVGSSGSIGPDGDGAVPLPSWLCHMNCNRIRLHRIIQFFHIFNDSI